MTNQPTPWVCRGQDAVIREPRSPGLGRLSAVPRPFRPGIQSHAAPLCSYGEVWPVEKSSPGVLKNTRVSHTDLFLSPRASVSSGPSQGG